MPKMWNGDIVGGKLLLTESETCERLGLSRSTLRRLWSDGAISPVKIGRALRFPAAELERYVASLQERTP